MKTRIKNSFLPPVLVAALGSMLARQMTAQTFATLHTFGAGVQGSYPQGLIMSDNILYGTTLETLFAIKLDGTGFTTLRRFTYPDGSPHDELILSGNKLYGTAYGGGSLGYGSVFTINTDGTGFTNLYSFTAGRTNSSGVETNSDGAYPHGPLILSGNTLYGTTGGAGSSGSGTVFKVNTDGTGFTNLHSFTAALYMSEWVTNSDGVWPQAGLILSSNTLYGTAQGGNSGRGAVFALNTDGTGFRVLYSFTASSTNSAGAYTNSDGAFPHGPLILSGNTLYGTAEQGGSSDSGTVFKVNTDGMGFANLYNFPALIHSYYSNFYGGEVGTNSDGARPRSGLVVSGNTLYGTADLGGAGGNGTVFAINTDGTGFTSLHSFTAATFYSLWVSNSDGVGPNGLILSGNILYGTAHDGGSAGYGTVFSISFTAQLTIIPLGANVILSWPTNYAGFDYSSYTVQSTTNLLSPVWTVVSLAPVVVNGKNTVTNPISSTQQFFRLSR